MASTSLSQDARIAQNPIKDRKHEQDVTEVASGSAEQLELSSKQEHGDTDVPKDPSKSLDQIFDLLRAKDDNSRFVGLALLKPVLDKQADLQNDAGILERCWAAIPAKFLDRLLKAGANEKKSKEESISMVELAVAVMHAFIRLLPQNLQDNTKIIGRIKGLINALGWRYYLIYSMAARNME